jgi:hypothetical protein
MTAFSVQTKNRDARPNREAYESLIGSHGSTPIARMGWSYRDDLDLRKLTEAKKKGRWKGGKGRDDAWGCHSFYDKVKRGDFLFYRDLPAKGRFTVVKVDGDYSYLKRGDEGGDFRSFRPCKLIVDNFQLSDSVVGSALRTQLKLPGRISEIPTNLCDAFLKRLKKGGGSNSSAYGAGGKGADLGLLKKKFSYVIGRHETTVNKEHLAYQIRLKNFLESKELAPKFERDYIDVEFSIGNESFIGEVKVTNWLSITEAFRIAVGQILDYAYTRRTNKHGMMIFLDKELDNPRRLELASKLQVSVVVERKKGAFELLNPEVNNALRGLFVEGEQSREK